MKPHMKRISIYRIFAVLVTMTLIYSGCTKDTANVMLSPQIATSQVINIASDSARVVGFIIAGGNSFTERGVYYGTDSLPTAADNKAIYAGPNTKATFNVTLTGLAYATKYYARAYGIDRSGTVYGTGISFTTLPVVPTLLTDTVTAITGNSATGGGNVTNAGGADVTARGVCFATSHNPTIANSMTSDGKGTGAFVSSLTGLKGNSVYYIRAYATNSAGTGYGPERSFTTLVDLPVVITSPVTNIAQDSARSGGRVSYDGGASVTARGLAWGTAANPTILNNIIPAGQDTGTFVCLLRNLTKFTTYHVRAYATNSAGTAYGSDISFTTLADITKFWVVGDYNGWNNSDAASYIISTPSSGGTAQGYVYLTVGAFKLVTDHSWDNAHTYGDNGSNTGILSNVNGGQNIPVTTAGYYFIQASLSTMTYSYLLTTWSIIGDATPGGWSTDTPLAFNAANQIWTSEVHLTSGGYFKFRANDSWNSPNPNYGSTAADGMTLDQGGANIPVTFTADYAITLNLSVPNQYTYSANYWGVIGDFNNWSADVVMTWDATNKVFTATITAPAAGAFKFRANGAWTVNLGGDPAALTYGGGNLPLASAGIYTITLDPWGLTATITKN